MAHDGFVAQKRRGFVSGEERNKERVVLQHVQNFECLEEKEVQDL